MKLNEFCKLLNLPVQKQNSIIENITINSKEVKENSIFIALKGKKFDGNSYINDAFKRGALIVLSDNKERSEHHSQIFYIANLPLKLGEIAGLFYGAIPNNIIAVTGTNGKSSVVDFAMQLFVKLNYDAATIGTMGFYYNNKLLKQLANTTPDILSLYKYLSSLDKKHCHNVLFEASSHGITQGRIANIPIQIAVFTNLTQDHLDYHHDMENYFAAKAKLFANYLAGNGIAIVNADSNYAVKLKAICDLRGIKYFDFGKNAEHLKIIEYDEKNITIKYQNKIYQIPWHLKGEFQIYNIICAISILLNSAINLENIISQTASIMPVKGRLEEIKVTKEYKVFIDYAHTPSALENALCSLRPYVSGKLILVFGCGGERDQQKRPLMGQVAEKYSDYIIVTDDNPRNEDADNIRSDILANISNAKEIAGRKTAILHALNIVESGDVILIAGKGHEDYQIIGDNKQDFNDAQIVKELIAECGQ